MSPIRPQLWKRPWLVLGIIIVATTLLLWAAPEERVLGQGIKAVYVHVALMWAGMVGLAVATILGVGVAITERVGLSRRMQIIGWVSLIFFAGGVGMSVVAAKVNWGAMAWDEPRTAAALQIIAVAVILLSLAYLISARRIKGLLNVILGVYMAIAIGRAPLVMHPANPIGEATSSAIQFTFLAMFALCGLGEAYLIYYLSRRMKSVQELRQI